MARLEQRSVSGCDNHHPGSHSWTLMLLLIGLAIGCLNAWHWVG